MADWEEIKRLAADLQRAQLSGAVQRLSERNCIEIVQRLIELGHLEVIHTIDGKEYLTPTELSKEIREELLVHGGRVSLVDVQQALNVDYCHIESKANEIVKNDRSIVIVLGQLIDRNYLDSLAEEVNDKLQENGTVTIAELAKTYNLPGDFIKQALTARLGHAIKGRIDSADQNMVYTDAFVSRHRAKIRGLLSACTKPISVQTVMQRCGLQSQLFHNILDGLIASGDLHGSLTGGRQEKAVFIPSVYTKTQEDWVDSFFKQNGYLEYDAVQRLGIVDPKSYIKKRLKNDSIEYLGSCCVGGIIRDQIESEVDEALSNGSFADIMPLLPSICSRADAGQLVNVVVRSKPSAVVLCDSIVTCDKFLAACSLPFEDLVNERAEKAVRENPSLLVSHLTSDKSRLMAHDNEKDNAADGRKDQRKKKTTTGKSGGGGAGSQGREVRTKATKKKYVGHGGGGGGGHDSESENDDEGLRGQGQGPKSDQDFMTREEIIAELRRQAALVDCSDDFVETIASRLYRSLTRKYNEKLKSVFLLTVQGNVGTATGGGAAKRKVCSNYADRISGLWVNVKLFEKGVKLFDDELQSQLNRYLLKTICNDIANAVYSIYAADVMMAVPETGDFTPEMRNQLISAISDDKTRATLGNFNRSLSAKTTEEFLTHLETICGPGQLNISLRKPDKKKERQLIFNHRQSLADQLRQETDAAMTLHIASVLMVHVHTQCMIHTPGRCVPQLIEFLRQYTPNDQFTVLTECQDLVMKHLKLSNDANTTDVADIASQLEQLVVKVKDIALNTKRSANAPTVDDAS